MLTETKIFKEDSTKELNNASYPQIKISDKQDKELLRILLLLTYLAIVISGSILLCS